MDGKKVTVQFYKSHFLHTIESSAGTVRMRPVTRELCAGEQ